MKIPISDYCPDLRFLSFRVSGLRGAKLWKRSILPLLFFLAAPLVAQQKPLVEISGYTIDAQLSPADHKLSATASVTFTALDNSDNAIFELHGALKVEKVTDTTGKALTGERAQTQPSSSPRLRHSSKGSSIPGSLLMTARSRMKQEARSRG
ncbi:MAG: hypothetical protein QJR10_12735 [Bacillota bacterium]|nr:hypothetical protein [Bacillota bacterium]